MRKKTLAMLLAGMAVLALPGCGSSTGETSAAADGSETADEKIEIEFWHCMGSSNGELIEQLTEAFNESQDKIYVKAVQQGSYTEASTKMQAALAAGEAPVVAQMEIGSLGVFADSGQLVDLQKYVDAENFDLDDFMPGLLDASYYNGELIALPHSRSLPVLYYNKDQFAAAGVENPPETWDELKETAKTLTGDGVYGYSCPLDQWYYTSLMMNAGGTIYNEDETGIGFNGQDYNSSEACRNVFAAGTASMIMQSSAQLKGLEETCDFEVGVAAIPMLTDRAYPAGGSNLMMFAGHSEEEEAAGWEFLKFMTNTENAITWANGTGYLPVRQSCTEQDSYKQMVEEDPNLQVITDNVQYCAEATFIPEYAETKDIITNEMQKCILEDDYTPEEAVQSMADQVAELFQ